MQIRKACLLVCPACLVMLSSLLLFYFSLYAASGSNTPVPRAKRPRRTRNSELAEILAEQQNRTAETLQKHTELIFEQQRQLLEDEQKKLGDIMSTISTSFLQGRQAMMAQLLSQPLQAYPQPLQIYSQALQQDSQQSRLFQFTWPIFTTAPRNDTAPSSTKE